MSNVSIIFTIIALYAVAWIYVWKLNKDNKELEKENDELYEKLKEASSKGDTAKIAELKHEVKMLQNRCSALTDGTMCIFCPFECEARLDKQLVEFGKEEKDDEEV